MQIECPQRSNVGDFFCKSNESLQHRHSESRRAAASSSHSSCSRVAEMRNGMEKEATEAEITGHVDIVVMQQKQQMGMLETAKVVKQSRGYTKRSC
jgi:hypothetical protein